MGFVLAAVAVVVVGSLVARRLAVPVPVVLVLAGLGYAMLPGPNVELDPDVVLVVVIPPLLYAAAIEASLIDIRANRRPIASLSVGLVLATAFAVGGLLAAMVPGLPFAAALALGAAVAPPDPVAALGVARRAGLPPRLLTLVEGEGLLNDATALTMYQVAVAAATGAGFSMVRASGQFALAALGGIAIGLAVAWLRPAALPAAGRPAAGDRDVAGHAVRRVPAGRPGARLGGARGRRRRAVDQPLVADGHPAATRLQLRSRLAAGRAAAGGPGVPAHRAASAGRARRAGRHRADPHGAGLPCSPWPRCCWCGRSGCT